MGEIVMLGDRGRRNAGGAIHLKSGGAEILFFTGVRYERAYIAAQEPPEPRKSGKPAAAQRPRRRKQPA